MSAPLLARVARSGNSLVVTLPRSVILLLGLKHLDYVSMDVKDRVLRVVRVPLEEMVRFTEEPTP